MGWIKGAAAGATKGTWAGLGGMAFGALVGGLSNMDDDDGNSDGQTVVIDSTGIFFSESQAQISMKDVRGITDIGENIYQFELRGGLIFFASRIQWDIPEGEREVLVYGETDAIDDKEFLELIVAEIKEMLNSSKDIFEIGDDFEDDETFRQAVSAVSDVLWASTLADKIRGSENIVLDENYFLASCFRSYRVTLDWWARVAELFSEGDEACAAAVAGVDEDTLEKSLNIDDHVAVLKRQLSRIDPDDEDLQELIAQIFAESRVSGKGVDAQARLYDNLRNAKAYGWNFENNELAEALNWDSEEKGFKPFGDEQWTSRRNTIVCTDQKAAMNTWHDGLNIQGVMVMDAQDITSYNNSVAVDKQLKFEISHPKNGVVYVQHPMQKNVYIDVESFHSSLLERKYNELKRLLDALGATSIVCDVENSISSDEKRHRKVDAGVNGSVPFVGEGSVEGGYSRGSSKMCALYKKLQTRIENRKTNDPPAVPKEGLLFYNFEDDWKNLAENVINGRRLEEEATLAYRKDFGVTGQSIVKLETKLKSVVPGYEFGAGANFSYELDEELKQLESTSWHYHVKFGEAQTGAVDVQPRNVVVQSAKDDYKSEETGNPKECVESRIAKIAKSYAQSECGRRNGCLTEAQRAPLVALAKKYDIDDFRFEEIIAGAFAVV